MRAFALLLLLFSPVAAVAALPTPRETAAASAQPTAPPVPWILAPVQPDANLPDAKVDGKKLLLACERAFMKIKSMKGTIRERSLIVPIDEKATEAESDFWYRRSDEVRFENTFPIPHTVVWNGKTLWVWSPRENAIVETKGDELDAASRSVFGVLPGYGIDVLAPIVLDQYTASARTLGTKTAVLLDPITPGVSLQVVVDPAKSIVERLTLVSGTAVVADSEFLDIVEAKPGVHFAREVHSKIRLPDGTGLEKLRFYERLKYDIGIEDAKFAFEVPPGAKRISLPSKAGGLKP